jgi:hypothetical protein
MTDMGTVAIILLGIIVIAGCVAVFVEATAPRDEDYYEAHLADLMALTNSRTSQRGLSWSVPPTGDPVGEGRAVPSNHRETVH